MNNYLEEFSICPECGRGFMESDIFTDGLVCNHCGYEHENDELNEDYYDEPTY